MTLGVVLLSKNNKYIGEQGQLPARPSWDKDFITRLIKGKRVLCSKETLNSLPKSILKSAYFTTSCEAEYDINFGIDTFKQKPDLLIVVRSNDDLDGGYEFRLSGYELLVKRQNMELYL